MKKLLRDIWEETPFQSGVWIHKTNNKIAIARPFTEKGCEWEIDQGKVVNHPLFRIKQSVTKTGNGNFFFNRELKNYKFLQEDIEGFTPGKKHE